MKINKLFKIILFFLFLAIFDVKSAFAVINLTYWPSANPQEVQLAKELVDEWNRNNPEIQVKMQPLPASKSSEEVLLAAIVAKTTPDICSNILPSTISTLIRAKSVVNLSQFKDFEPYMKQRLLKEHFDYFRYTDGNYYQIPWKANPLMLAYNVRLFKQLGIKPPRTYSEFWKTAKILTRDSNGDGQIDQWAMAPSINITWWQRLFDFYPFYIAATSGQTLVKNNKVIFNNQGAIDAMNFFYTGFKNKWFPKATFIGDSFLDGKVGMQVTGPWAISYFNEFKKPDFEFNFTPIPVPDNHKGPSYTYGDPKNMVIFSTCKNPQAAWKFVKFMISEKADYKLFDICRQFPLRKNIARDPGYEKIFQKNPYMRIFARQLDHIAMVDDNPNLVQILDYISQQYEACAIYNIIEPKKAIKMSADYAENIMRFW